MTQYDTIKHTTIRVIHKVTFSKRLPDLVAHSMSMPQGTMTLEEKTLAIVLYHQSTDKKESCDKMIPLVGIEPGPYDSMLVLE